RRYAIWSPGRGLSSCARRSWAERSKPSARHAQFWRRSEEQQLTEKVTIGAATLYRADCRDIIPALPMVDLVVTSPPYNLGATPWVPLGHWKPGNAASSGGQGKWTNGANSGGGVEYGTHEDAMPWVQYVAWQHGIIGSLWDKLSDAGAIY